MDDEPKEMTSYEDYDAEKQAFLDAAPPPSPSTIPGASAADLAAQGLTSDGAPPASAPTPPQPSQPVPVTAVPPLPEDDLEPEQGKLPRFNNVRAVDSVDVQALAAYKAAQKTGTLGGKSMVQFMAEFAGPKGQPSESVTKPADAGQPVDTTQEPTTVAEVDAHLQALREKRYQLLEGFDFAEAAKIEQQEDALRSKREGIRDSEASSQLAVQTAVEQADTKALATVAEWFPQATNPADPLVAKCNEIVAEWEASDDPLLSKPNRYLLAYTEAAEALGIKPVSSQPGTQTPPPVQIPSTTAPAHRPPTSAILASGGARDIPRAPVSDSLDDYEKEKAALLSGSFARKAA